MKKASSEVQTIILYGNPASGGHNNVITIAVSVLLLLVFLEMGPVSLFPPKLGRRRMRRGHQKPYVRRKFDFFTDIPHISHLLFYRKL
jgi:hypothetical protein